MPSPDQAQLIFFLFSNDSYQTHTHKNHITYISLVSILPPPAFVDHFIFFLHNKQIVLLEKDYL